MDLKQRAVSGGRWNMLSSVITFVFQLVKNLVVVRLLQPEDMGLFAMLAVFLTVADSFADAGLSAGIVHKQTLDRKVLSSLFWFNILAGTFVFFVLLAITPLVVTYYSESRLAPLGIVLFSGILLRSPSKQLEMNLLRDLEFRAIAVAEVVSEGCSVLAAVLLAAADCGVWALVVSSTLSAFVRSSVLLANHWSRYRPSFHFDFNDIRPYLRFGGFQMAETTVRFLAQRIDVLVLGRWMGAATLGLYNFASQTISIPIQRVNPVVTRIAFPVFARIQHEQMVLRRSYIRAVRLLCVVNAPLLMGISATAPWSIPLVFGEKWIAAVPYVQIAALLGYFRSTGNPAGSLFMAKGRTDIGFIQNLVLVAANIPAVMIGLRLWGGLGVLCGLIGVQILLTVPLYFFVHRKILGPCAGDFFWASLRPLLVALVAFAVGWNAGLRIDGGGTPGQMMGALVSGIVSMGIFAIGIWIFDRATINDLYSLIRRRKEMGHEA